MAIPAMAIKPPTTAETWLIVPAEARVKAGIAAAVVPEGEPVIKPVAVTEEVDEVEGAAVGRVKPDRAV
jgi:hypothetical protein